MLRLVVLIILASICIVSARYIEEPGYNGWRRFLDDQIVQVFIPRRMVRQDLLDYTPTPCRWKLCASFYR